MSKILLSKLEESLSSGILLQFVDDSLAITHVLAKLGYAKKGQYLQIVSQFLSENDIDVSHFTSNGKPKAEKIEKTCLCCGTMFRTEPRTTREQVVCSRACSNTHFRSGPNNGNFIDGYSGYRAKAFHQKPNECSRCGYKENTAALEVHHKDHNRSNNDIENLIILCANCHAITHWGK